MSKLYVFEFQNFQMKLFVQNKGCLEQRIYRNLNGIAKEGFFKDTWSVKKIVRKRQYYFLYGWESESYKFVLNLSKI